jgi:TolA-binding protein
MRHLLIAAILFTSTASVPLLAQSKDVIPLRVDKLEKEMRAVQRKVFPNGVAVEPEIGGSASGESIGNPSGTPITDLTARVDALEAQLKSMTGQVELNGNRMKKLEEAMKTTDARLKALEPSEPVAELTPPAAPKPVAAAVVAPKPTPVATPKPSPAIAKPAIPTVKPAQPTRADPKRKALIDAVEIPATGDATEDAYSYAFRLWQAKLYPEAQAKFKEFVTKHATHKRASYAQNLLGRAYLDEGKPALASVAFYDNYQRMPRGERASESLYWLGIALTRLNKPADACKAYKEFSDVYSSSAPSDLKAKVTKGKADAKCTA